jgi:acyl carrier protein
MDPVAIRDNIRQSISRITGISPEEIADGSDFVADLGLDSLSLLEMAVDIELAYHVKLDDAVLSQLTNIEKTARVIAGHVSITAQA